MPKISQNEINPTLYAALHYAAQGIPVFPVHKIVGGKCSCERSESCKSIGKHPAINGWTTAATTDEAIITRWFSGTYTNFNVGALMGSGLICLDIDVKGSSGKNGNLSVVKLEEKHGKLPEGLEQQTPSGGRHLVFRTAMPIGRHISKDEESDFFGLDILGANSYIVVHPSTTEKGRYNWTDGQLPDLGQVAQLPREWCTALMEVCTISESNGISRAGGNFSFDQVLASLPAVDPLGVDEAGLEKMSAALSWIPSSGWSDAHSWFKMLCAIKEGANDQRGLQLALDWSAATNDNGDQAEQYGGADDVAYHWNRISTRGDLRDTSRSSIFHYAKQFGYPNNGRPKHYVIGDEGEVEVEFKVVSPSDAGKVGDMLNDEEEINTIVDVGLVDAKFFDQFKPREMQAPKCLENKTALIGVLADIHKVIESENPSPQPLLAALATFPILGTMTRRNYVGCPELKNTRMNLMTLGVAPSGAGKDASLKAGGKILRALGLNDAVGRESKSGSAYHSQTVTHPNLYHAQDEIGKWWQSQGGTAYGQTVKPFFLKAFTSSGDTGFIGVEYAPSKANDSIKEVDYPHVNLYGVSTPAALYESLTNIDMQDGIIGRMLLGEAYERPDIEDTVRPDLVAMDGIQDWYTRMMDALQQTGSPLGGHSVDSPIIIQADEDALQFLKEKAKVVRGTIMKNLDEQGLADCYARWLELANKLACLMAVARDPVNPVVTKLEAMYASEIVDYSCALWVSVFKQEVSETPEMKNKQKIMKYLHNNPTYKAKRKSKGQEVTKELPMTIGVLKNWMHIPARDFDSAFDALVDGGLVILEGKKCSLAGKFSED